MDPTYLCKDLVNNQRRILILECAERMIMERFSGNPGLNAPVSDGVPEISIMNRLNHIRDRWFVNSERNYAFFLNNSIFFSPIVERWNSMNFNVLGRISRNTPVFSINPPFLFLAAETDPNLVSSFYCEHSDAVITRIAANLKTMRENLDRTCNVELIFMPVPNKYTICHGIVNKDSYDLFVPRLCSELERRGVATIRLYEKFISSPDQLYFPTDTHWNANGISIALDETRKTLEQYGL